MRAAAAACLLALIPLVACRSEEESAAEAREEIQELLLAYLPVLAEAYREGDVEPLLEWVAEKEVARIAQRIDELAAQGRRFAPTFREVTVEDVRVWGHANAFVVTVEIWDLRSETLDGRQVVQEVADQVNRVRYQMKKDGGRWRILFRTIAD